MPQQLQLADGKRKRDTGPDNNNSAFSPAGFVSLASSSSATASPIATPSYPSSAASSPTSTTFTRYPKPNRLSASTLSSSIWSPPATSTSPILGEDSRQFFTKHPMRILAAEDNAINQKVLAKMLDRLGWPRELVTIVPNGKMAWDGVAAAAGEDELLPSVGLADLRGDSDEDAADIGRRLQHEPYHLVFMDIYMPVMDGLDATTSIRSDSRISATTQPYVVALTANAMTGDKQKCLEAGMEFFLSKPVTLGPLMQALRTGFATICNKRKQTLVRLQREDGSRHQTDGAGKTAAAEPGTGDGSASGGDRSESQTAVAELRRRGVAQTITSPTVRPSRLAQLGFSTASAATDPPQQSSTSSFAASPKRAAGQSAAAGTSPSSAPSQTMLVLSPPQSTSELPSLSFARISSAPLSLLTGRLLATSHQLQLLASMGHTPTSPRQYERASTGESVGQRDSSLVSSTSKALQSTVPSG